jgi:tRNA pseudouridine38-40 synthase
VQGELEAALGGLLGAAVEVTGAGRTDAGVHATGQVAHVDMGWSGLPAELAGALNARLAADIRVRHAALAPPSFHARHSALARCYRYRLLPAAAGGPGLDRRALRWRRPLVLAWMREAAAAFRGVHDFSAFGRPVGPAGTCIRRIDRLTVAPSGPGLAIEVEGNAFLRHQVRRMVALLVEVGQGRRRPDVVAALLAGAAMDRPLGRAPAAGLTLTAVRYPARLLGQMRPAGWPDDLGNGVSW